MFALTFRIALNLRKNKVLDQRNDLFLWKMLYYTLHVPDGQNPFPKDIVLHPEIATYVDGWGRDGDTGFIGVDDAIDQSIGFMVVKNDGSSMTMIKTL